LERLFRIMRYGRRERSGVSMLRSVTSSRRWNTFLRYAAGSLVATGCSEAVLIAGYGLFGLGPQTASIVAWFAGAVPNYLLNRRWAWRGRGKAALLREMLPYWVITLGTAALAIAATTAVDGWVRHEVAGRGARSILLGTVYLAAYGLVFILKFALFDGWVFSHKRSAAAMAESS
jgi:putative flippase GtrA